MARTVLGLFQDRDEVQKAIDQLESKGFNSKDISILMRDQKEAKELGNDTGANVAGGAASGAATGLVIGGIAGLLAGTILPGIGAILVGGPIATALGLGGAAATTVSGAATGLVAGGIIGALMGWGLTKDEAEHYETRIKEGAILLAVPAAENEVSYVTQIFDDNSATDIRTLVQAEEGTQRTGTSRHYADRDIDENADQSHFQESVRMYGTKGGNKTSGKGMKGGIAGREYSIANPVQVQKYLKGVDYPVSKDDLVNTAQREGADQNVIGTLQEMPGEKYNSPNDVAEAIGKME